MVFRLARGVVRYRWVQFIHLDHILFICLLSVILVSVNSTPQTACQGMVNRLWSKVGQRFDFAIGDTFFFSFYFWAHCPTSLMKRSLVGYTAVH